MRVFQQKKKKEPLFYLFERPDQNPYFSPDHCTPRKNSRDPGTLYRSEPPAPPDPNNTCSSIYTRQDSKLRIQAKVVLSRAKSLHTPNDADLTHYFTTSSSRTRPTNTTHYH